MPTCSQLYPIHAAQAWSAGGGAGGLQGQGVKVGVLDSGVDPSLPAMSGRFSWYKNYIAPGSEASDLNGHGSAVAEILGGAAAGNTGYRQGDNAFQGGVAPQSSLYIAGIADETGTAYRDPVAQAVGDLAMQGVRLFNFSYGREVADVTQDADAASIYARVLQPLLSNDALMVIAAGNSHFANPANPAGIPYFHPAFAHNILAVVNVSLDAQGKVTGLDPTSNACGVAAQWCLAAPGLHGYNPQAGVAEGSGVGNGTSFAAPVVTGVAALVWQKYPYFSSANVQETLLGTATSLGDASVYGYGLVNAAAAVKGPGALNWGQFDLTIPSAQSGTFDNDITGAGGITLRGSGTLALAGSNSYKGPTNVVGGTLLVNGSLASSINVSSGASLGGAGRVNADVLSSGRVGTAWGALKIHGNYTASADAETQIRLGSPLQVDGTASIAGTVSTLVPDGYIARSKEPLLQAGTLTGTFDSLKIIGSVYVSGVLSYTSNEADVSLRRNSAKYVVSSAASSQANTRRSAEHIDRVFESIDERASSDSEGHDDFIAAVGQFLHAPTVPAAVDSIDSLSGQIHASSQALTLSQAGLVNRALADRLADIAPAGGWIQTMGAKGQVGRAGFATGRYSGGGAMAGYDVDVTDQWRVGAAAQWNKLNAGYDQQAGTSDANSQGASLYARFIAGNGYVFGRVAQDWVDSQVNRYALLGSNRQTIGTQRRDALTSMYMEAGYRFGGLAPFVSVTEDDLRRGAFAETGAGGFGLVAGEQDFNQVLGQAGARWTFAHAWAAGNSTFSAYGLFQTVLSGRNTAFRAAFVGAPKIGFEVAGAQTPVRSGWLGIGISTQAGKDWSWYLNANAQVGGGATRARELSAGVRYAF